MRVGVIVVAAGRGERLGGSVPKQLMTIAGRTILQRSVSAFDGRPSIESLIVVLPPSLVAEGPALAGRTVTPLTCVAGGTRRQDSVQRGVEALPPEIDLVLIHDAARPFVDAALIERVIRGAEETGAALAAIPARDTVKRVPRDRSVVAETIPRDEIWLAQTPQGFRRAVLERAVALGATGMDATDEAMLAERAGDPVAVVQGDERNVKITTMEDLEMARARVAAVPRVGTGYDLHRLVAGRSLILAGVRLPSDVGPLGHSDGDVVCHALVDGMFGAAALGDIGRHFPNTDPAWKDAAGLALLARARAILETGRWRVSSADVTVVLERPKLAPHVEAIRAAIAAELDLPVDRVSVKAKTNEGVDAVGRGEAIAAHAVVVVLGGGPC